MIIFCLLDHWQMVCHVNKIQSLSFLARLSKWSNSGQGCCLDAYSLHNTEQQPSEDPACAPQGTQQTPYLLRASSTKNAFPMVWGHQGGPACFLPGCLGCLAAFRVGGSSLPIDPISLQLMVILFVDLPPSQFPSFTPLFSSRLSLYE